MLCILIFLTPVPEMSLSPMVVLCTQLALIVDFTDVSFELPTTLYGSIDICPVRAHVAELSIEVRDPGPYMVCMVLMSASKHGATLSRHALVGRSHAALTPCADGGDQCAAADYLPNQHERRSSLDQHICEGAYSGFAPDRL